MPEILAPAGSRQQLEAAFGAGADAVYLGLQGFNARQGAHNFRSEELPEVVAFCRGHGARVYVTLNTLVTDDEMERVRETITAVAEAGAHGLIVQDLGVASVAKAMYPALPLHASTQMAIHNTWGTVLLEQMGYERVVLARELSLEEIRQVAGAAKLPLEVFVHGAHCTCVSGNCYLSSMLGGRSGNRGLCAQPCRLDFRLDGRSHALSLKDLSVLSSLQQLQKAGVSSFKIEGRLKRPEYVAAAVTGCKAALAGKKPDTALLRDLFSRSGFTDGYLKGRPTAEMFGYRTREDVQASAAALGSMPELTREASAPIPVDMKLKISWGRPAALTLNDGSHSVTVTGPLPQQAVERELTLEVARRGLQKTGGTPFVLGDLSVEVGEGLTLSLGEINALRRSGLEALAGSRDPLPVYERASEGTERLGDYRPPAQPEIRLRFEQAAQIFDEAGAHRLILPLDEILSHPDLLEAGKSPLIGEIPSLVFPSDEAETLRKLEMLAQRGLQHVLCDNLGAAHAALGMGFTVHGGPSLNVLNSRALRVFQDMGLADVTLSFESSFAQVRRLEGELARGVIGYGYLPLMKLRACPARTKTGCENCSGLRILRDRKGITFPLICRDRKYSELLNSVPLYVADKSIPRLDFQTLYFTTEDRASCRDVLAAYLDKKPPAFPRTGGLYYRKLL